MNRAKTLRDSTDSLFGGRFSYGDARTVRVDAVLSRYDRQERADNAAVDAGVRFPVPAFISDTDFQRSNATLSATHDYNDRASIVVGLEYQKEEGSLTSVGDFLFAGSPQTFSFQLDRKTTSAFVEGRVRLLPELAVQVGLRYDDVEGLDSETTPHLGLVWDLPNSATTLKANYNEGFKPPSFFALGFPIGGNPDLRPERSKNIELALAHKLDGSGSQVQVSVFRTEYEDLVDFDATTFTNINRGKVVVQGIEPELRFQLMPQWRVQANATLLKIEERDGRQPLRNRPERQANVSTWFDFDERNTVFGAAALQQRLPRPLEPHRRHPDVRLHGVRRRLHVQVRAGARAVRAGQRVRQELRAVRRLPGTGPPRPHRAARRVLTPIACGRR